MDKQLAFAYLAELESKGIVLGLGRIRRFLRLLGSPEKQFKAIHIAGTNGKGSTAAMIESILRKAGCRTALYSSPHLLRLNERIQVNGRQISDKKLAGLVAELRAMKEREKIPLTHFEFVTALAFVHFARCKVEFAVIEVGMGGRLDATNVIVPEVSIITNIEKEHERFLGRTIGKIAREKAGIIKRCTAVVTAEWKKPVLGIFRKKCREKNSKLVVVRKPFPGKLPLLGLFQQWNAAAAVAAVKELQLLGFAVDSKAVKHGLSAVRWPGRFEIVQGKPTVVLDCCHNPSGAFVLAEAFKQHFQKKKAVLLIGVSNDKKIRAMASALAAIARRVIATEASYRAMPAGLIKNEFERHGLESETVLPVKEATKKAIAIAGKKGVVLVCGSLFVVGEALPLFKTGRSHS